MTAALSSAIAFVLNRQCWLIPCFYGSQINTPCPRSEGGNSRV
jgi:hypothetical protein